MASKPINEVIADNLRVAMSQHKVLKTQAALAEASGVAQTTISLYLSPSKRLKSKSGKEPSAKVTELASLAGALGIEVWMLLREMTEKERRYYQYTERAYAELVANDPDGFTGNTGPGELP